MTVYIPVDSSFYFHIEDDRLHKTHYKLMVNVPRARYVYTNTESEDLEQELLSKIAIEMTDCWKIMKGEINETEI